MINESLYNKTVDILVQAYFDNTLEHQNCFACAIGNLICSANGFSFQKKGEYICMNHCVTLGWKEIDEWYNNSSTGFQKIWAKFYRNPKEIHGEIKESVEKTGYCFDELLEIEKAFESVQNVNSDDEYMFNGLMAVIEVLDEIHQNKDEKITKETKQKFNKSKQLVF